MYERSAWVTLENGGEGDAAVGSATETGRGTAKESRSGWDTERYDAERTEEGLLRRFFCAQKSGPGPGEGGPLALWSCVGKGQASRSSFRQWAQMFLPLNTWISLALSQKMQAG